MAWIDVSRNGVGWFGLDKWADVVWIGMEWYGLVWIELIWGGLAWLDPRHVVDCDFSSSFRSEGHSLCLLN